MEFFNEITSAANIIPTVLVGVVLLYWIMIIVGFIGMDAIDVDLDAGVGVDGDMDFEVGGPGLFASLTHFLNMQDVPVVIVGSFFIIFWWIVTVSVNHLINPDQGVLISAVILLPCVAASLFLTRLATMPLAKGFKNYDEFQDTRERLIGSITVVTSSAVTTKSGRVELATDGAEITMNADRSLFVGEKLLRKTPRFLRWNVRQQRNCRRMVNFWRPKWSVSHLAADDG